MGDPLIVAAAITAFGTAATAAVVQAFQLRGLKRDVKTNSGQRPGEYLEQIADVAEVSVQTLTKLNELDHKVDKHRLDVALGMALLNGRMDRVEKRDIGEGRGTNPTPR